MLLIEQATVKDIPIIAQIESICFPKAEKASLHSFQARFQAFPEQFLVAKIYNEDDYEIVGFINGMTTDSLTIFDEMYDNASLHNPKGAYQSVFGLDVLPSYQHQKIAHKLLWAFIDKAKNAHKTGVILTCKYHLIGFYEQFGFKNRGISQSTHGDVTWYDMLLQL